MMSTSNDHVSESPTILPLTSIIANGNHVPDTDSTPSTWKDVEEALSLPKCLPSAVQTPLVILQHLLLTNIAPSSRDCVVVSECVRLLDDLISKSHPTIALTLMPYEHITGEQTALRHELETKHANLYHLRQRVHSIKSVVRRLPQEIWQEIFFFVCPSENEGKLNVFHLQNPLYVVSQSQIVVATSEVRSQREGLLRLDTVLKRARSVPLDFVFFSRRENAELSIALLSLLTDYSHQWRSAQIISLTPNEARPLELLRGRVPELLALNLSFTKGGDVQRTDLISAFQSAPKLFRVVLQHFPLDQLLFDPSVKQNLRFLTITYPEEEADRADTDSAPSAVSDIICQYPSLKLLNLFRKRQSTARAYPAPCLPRTVHARLKVLGTVEGHFLNRVSLPSSTTLQVGRSIETLTPLLPCVIGLLRHSRCCLKFLVLCSAEWDEESLGVLLALVPHLAMLTVAFRSMQDLDDMFRILTRCLSATGDNGLKYVPQLKTLSILAAQFTWTFIDKEFLDVVSMRAEHGLTSVRLYGLQRDFRSLPVLEGDDLRQWRELEKGGLIHVLRPLWLASLSERTLIP